MLQVDVQKCRNCQKAALSTTEICIVTTLHSKYTLHSKVHIHYILCVCYTLYSKYTLSKQLLSKQLNSFLLGKERVMSRPGHPTLKPSASSLGFVERFVGDFLCPAERVA